MIPPATPPVCWLKSIAAIGYQSGKDGATLPICFLSHIIKPLLTYHEVKMGGYWPRYFFVRVYEPPSFHNHAEKDVTNIQPS